MNIKKADKSYRSLYEFYSDGIKTKALKVGGLKALSLMMNKEQSYLSAMLAGAELDSLRKIFNIVNKMEV